MKRNRIILSGVILAAGLGLTGCMGMGWSIASDPYGGTDVGISVSGGNYYAPAPPPPPPRPAPAPRPVPWSNGPGWPGPW